jgi:DNA-binding XRE family transcriptional regulator
MGKRSTRENKNVYQISREEAGLTREKAAEALKVNLSTLYRKLSDDKPENSQE